MIATQNVKSSHNISACHDHVFTLRYTKYSIHQVHHTPSTAYTEYRVDTVHRIRCSAYTEYNIHSVQHTLSSASTLERFSSHHSHESKLTNSCSLCFQHTTRHNRLTSAGSEYCKQQVRVTHQRSRFWLVVEFGSIWDLVKNPSRFVLVELLPRLDLNPDYFGRVVPRSRFHITVPATFAPIENVSCDCIVTWSIRRLYRMNHCFTSRVQIGDPTNSHCVALKKRSILGETGGFLIATKRIVVGSKIWTWEVKQRLILHNLHIDEVTIRSELRYLIIAKVVRL